MQTIAMNMNRIIAAGKSDKTPQDIAIHIAAAAPKEYETTVETIQKILKDNAASIDLEDIKMLFQDRYSHLKSISPWGVMKPHSLSSFRGFERRFGIRSMAAKA